MVDHNLERKLDQIRNAGLTPVVVPAPTGAITFDRMVVVYIDKACKRLYQVHFYDTKTSKVMASF